MFSKLFGKKPNNSENTEKQIHDTLDMTVGFLQICNDFLSDNFDKELNADTFYLLIGFQFGAFSKASQINGLTPQVTSNIFPLVLETVNGMSKVKAKQIAQKIPELIDIKYPPIDHGGEALLGFYSKSEELRYAATKQLSILMSTFDK